MFDIQFLDNIDVAAPCNASWEHMDGDERVRHCCGCKKNVYNLSAMTRIEAESLIREKEGKMCVRYFRRTDGTILTQNCPVGLKALRKLFLHRSLVVASLFALLLDFYPRSQRTTAGDMVAVSKEPELQEVAGNTGAPESVMGDIESAAPPVHTLGKVAIHRAPTHEFQGQAAIHVAPQQPTMGVPALPPPDKR